MQYSSAGEKHGTGCKQGATVNKQAAHGLRNSAGFKIPIHVHFFRGGGIFTSKAVRQIWRLLCDERSLADLCMQDYKSLCAAVTICATLTDRSTHMQTAF